MFASKSDRNAIYSNYDAGYAVGKGIGFEMGRCAAYRTMDGVRTEDVTVEYAEATVRERFRSLSTVVASSSSSSVGSAQSAAAAAGAVQTGSNAASVPIAATTTTTTTTGRRVVGLGLFANFFATRKFGPDGERMFKDHGDWGTYDGEIDESGNRVGYGKMNYVAGGLYAGPFVDDMYHGEHGVYRWPDGDSYSGGWKDGEQHGVGTFRSSDGTVEYYACEGGGGERGRGGLESGSDGGVPYVGRDEDVDDTSLDDAATFARETFNLPVPEPSSPATEPAVVVDDAAKDSSASLSSKKTGLLARLFLNKMAGPDGKPMFKDQGDWGCYEGDVDDGGNRTGNGKMTYSSGAYYEGGFIDNKFHGDGGIYCWAEGDEYEGTWNDGDRNGVGIFRSTDGTVTYSLHDMGVAIGEGLRWSADRMTVHKTVDGTNETDVDPARGGRGICQEKVRPAGARSPRANLRPRASRAQAENDGSSRQFVLQTKGGLKWKTNVQGLW